MTVNTITVGPGTFTVGAGPLDIASQCRGGTIQVSEKVTSFGTAPKKVLSGEVLPGKVDDFAEFSYVVALTLFQDLYESGIIAWSWENKGTEQPFTYTPDSALAASFSGIIYPVPINVGEAVGPDPEVSVNWRGKGDLPTPTWADDPA